MYIGKNPLIVIPKLTAVESTHITITREKKQSAKITAVL